MQGRFNGRVVGQDYTGRNARHNGRAGVYNAVQSAFGPSLDITLANGLSSLFTYTRATTATVPDFEPLIESCLSGELRIQGARRVYNQEAYSEDNTQLNGGRQVLNGGSVAATTITFGAGDNSYLYKRLNGTAVAGDVYRVRVKLSSATYTRISFRGTDATNWNAVGSFTGITSTPQVFSTTFTIGSPTVSTFEWGLQILAANGDSIAGGTITATEWQVEKVTGQSNQNPSEYVSVGVLSSPYHGYFADGVKYFSYENGNTVSSNVVTEAQGAALTGTIGYLPEGARTNLFKHSGDQTNAVYANAGLTSVTKDVTGPDGTTSASTYIESAASVAHYQYYDNTGAGITVSSGQTVACSFYLKAGTRRYVVLSITNGGNESGITVDTTTMTISGNFTVGTGTSSSASYVAETAANGFTRIVLVGAITGVTAYYPAIGGSLVSNATSVGTVYLGTSATWIGTFWQAEAGVSFASSYIPTTTAAVARNADVLTCPSAGIISGPCSVIIDMPEGLPASTAFAPQLWIAYTDGNNRAGVYVDSSGHAVVYVVTGGVAMSAVVGTTDLRGTPCKIGAVIANNDFRLYVNGVSDGVPVTSGTVPAFTTLAMGTYISGGFEAYKPIKRFTVYRTARSAAQMIAGTTL